MISSRFLLIVFNVVLIVHEGKTLKCWTCSDPFHPFLGSADDKAYHDSLIMECEKQKLYLQLLPNGTTRTLNISPGLEFSCFKLTGKVDWTKVVLRGCALGLPNITKGSCMDAEPQKATGGNILTCDACAGDLCNGAASVGPAVLVAPLLLLLTYLRQQQ